MSDKCEFPGCEDGQIPSGKVLVFEGEEHPFYVECPLCAANKREVDTVRQLNKSNATLVIYRDYLESLADWRCNALKYIIKWPSGQEVVGVDWIKDKSRRILKQGILAGRRAYHATQRIDGIDV